MTRPSATAPGERRRDGRAEVMADALYHNDGELFDRSGRRPIDRRFDFLNRPAGKSSDLDFIRYCHTDIPTLPDAELRREARILQHEIDRADAPHPWMWERLDVLRAELRNRRTQS